MTDEIERVAASLTKAQRACLMHLEPEPTQIHHGSLTAIYLKWKGLSTPTGDWMKKGRQYAITPSA